MEEDIDQPLSRYDDENDEDLWTIVNSEDLFPGEQGHKIKPEDCDSNSEQGSDGSSIVVLDSPSQLNEDPLSECFPFFDNIQPQTVEEKETENEGSVTADEPLLLRPNSEWSSGSDSSTVEENLLIADTSSVEEVSSVTPDEEALKATSENISLESEAVACAVEIVGSESEKSIPPVATETCVEDVAAAEPGNKCCANELTQSDVICGVPDDTTNQCPESVDSSQITSEISSSIEETRASCLEDAVNETIIVADNKSSAQFLAPVESMENVDELEQADNDSYCSDKDTIELVGYVEDADEAQPSMQLVSDDEDDDQWSLFQEERGSRAPSVASESPAVASAPSSRGNSMPKPDLLEEANRIEEELEDQLDYSSLTNQELPAELNVANIFRQRHYVHHPNQRLNCQLSYVVAFVMAAVIGFALGNIIGLYDNFPPRCSSPTEESGTQAKYQGWSLAGLRSELQQLSAQNEALMGALKESESCRIDVQNELATENWDLKHTVGRIRYGKPIRSIEDRDVINRLQTENQELRAQVGTLRYRCIQPPLSPSTSALPSPVRNNQQNPPASETRNWPRETSAANDDETTVGPKNLTEYWKDLVEWLSTNNSTDFAGFKQSTADLMQVIELRREELGNLTRDTDEQKWVLKMDQILQESAKKVIYLLNGVFSGREALTVQLTTKIGSKVEEIRLKLESRWDRFKRHILELDSSSSSSSAKDTNNQPTSSSSSSSSSSAPLNSEWFLMMGRQREQLRTKERQTEWMFERAKNREKERRFAKLQNRNKKLKDAKMFQPTNQWNNHYSV
jgi:L-rhamnose mutarotase